MVSTKWGQRFLHAFGVGALFSAASCFGQNWWSLESLEKPTVSALRQGEFTILKSKKYVPGSAEIPKFSTTAISVDDIYDEKTCAFKPSVSRQVTAIPVDLRRLNEDCMQRTGSFSKSRPATYQREVDVYFATDRKPVKDLLGGGYANERGSLSYGKLLIGVPARHKMGVLERRTKRYFRSDEEGFEILSLAVSDWKDFSTQSKAALDEKNTERVFLFVHGYNVSFADAALRTAQLAVDMDPDALPAFYSWPSQGAMLKYSVDSQNAEWAQRNFEQFLEQFGEAVGDRKIVVIAHSMGTRIATRALAVLLERKKELRSKYKELVLAAPDIDAEVFWRDLVPVYARLKVPVTLYASTKDKALEASRSYNGAPRAGDASALNSIIGGVEGIDASEIDTDFLGHAYAIETRPLVMDIALLVRNELRASARPGLIAVESGKQKFWRFRR